MPDYGLVSDDPKTLKFMAQKEREKFKKKLFIAVALLFFIVTPYILFYMQIFDVEYVKYTYASLFGGVIGSLITAYFQS